MVHRRWSSASGDTRFDYSAATSAGTVRLVNQDSYLAEPPVFLVADGMGGHAKGDAASAAAVASFSIRTPGTGAWTLDAVLDAVGSAHATIAALTGPGEEVAGTTLTGLVLVSTGSATEFDETTAELGAHGEPLELGYRWMVINVGDSRVYHLAADGFRQLTVDHSLVQQLVEQGVISAAEAEHHPERNVITKALGVEAAPVPDVLLLPAEGSNTFLVCSDGVSGAVTKEQLEAVMRANTADDAAQAVVDLALDSGSRDNVTALVLRASVTLHGPAEGGIEHFEETQPRGEVLA